MGIGHDDLIAGVEGAEQGDKHPLLRTGSDDDLRFGVVIAGRSRVANLRAIASRSSGIPS